MNAQGIGGEAQNKYMRTTGKKIQNEIAGQSAKAKRKHGDLEQFYIGSFDPRLDVHEVEFFKVGRERQDGKKAKP